jgi:hypothetical protein
MPSPRLDSAATAGEGRQNHLCAAQAAAVLTGLLTTSIWSGGCWIDPAIALAIAGWAIHEGNTAWRGDACGCWTHDPGADPDCAVDCPLCTVCQSGCHSTPVAGCHGCQPRHVVGQFFQS